MPRFYVPLSLLACLLVGCGANIADTPAKATGETAPQTTGAPRYAGESALVLLYTRNAKGDTRFLCSGALVTLDASLAAQPGILTAAHCFAEPDPDVHAFLASFDDGKSFHALKQAWVGDNMAGADIAFAEFDPSLKDTLRAQASLPVALAPPAVTAGDPLWSWGNPDNQGRALTLGYVMNSAYQKPPISGSIDGADVTLDLRGYIVTELNTAPGSSGGMVLSQHGVIGVVSSDFLHDKHFKTVFVTPIARLKPLFAQPPKALVGTLRDG